MALRDARGGDPEAADWLDHIAPEFALALGLDASAFTNWRAVTLPTQIFKKQAAPSWGEEAEARAEERRRRSRERKRATAAARAAQRAEAALRGEA